jgi:hypothetical protein
MKFNTAICIVPLGLRLDRPRLVTATALPMVALGWLGCAVAVGCARVVNASDAGRLLAFEQLAELNATNSAGTGGPSSAM